MGSFQLPVKAPVRNNKYFQKTFVVRGNQLFVVWGYCHATDAIFVDSPIVSDLFPGLVGMLLEVAPLVCRKYKFIVIRNAD